MPGLLFSAAGSNLSIQERPSEAAKWKKQNKTKQPTFALSGSRLKNHLENTGKDRKYHYSGLPYQQKIRVKGKKEERVKVEQGKQRELDH